MDIIAQLTAEFNLKDTQIKNTVDLLDDGRTVPFIARYRKELTGSLDDQTIRQISERLQYLRNLETRKQEIKDAITALDKMTPEIEKNLVNAKTLAEAEDVWLPFKKKKKTKADVAKEKGLEPLSNAVFLQDKKAEPLELAKGYINTELGVETAEDALEGALDIITRNVAEDSELKKSMRELIRREGVISSEPADQEAEENEKSVYKNYYDFHSPLNKVKGYMVLALNRGEKEKFLKVDVEIPEGMGEKLCQKDYVVNDSPCAKLVSDCCNAAFKDSIYPSCVREIRNEMTDSAEEGAIKIFSENLKQLLLQPPLKNSVTLGFDPGYRTGCKVAVVDKTGKVLDTGIVYATPGPKKNIAASEKTIKALIAKDNVTSIAIGNGTASRESEEFIAGVLKEIPQKVSYMVVSEAGASVYSASKLGAAEFPDYDVSLRSAVSIARRLQDPLAELVKIDPESIGVGQYQHDISKKKLSEALGGVVESCVNSVGVDLNTASFSLLSYIAGINSTIAKNIVAYREENGEFTNISQLKKVPRLGPKAFEECAGFLRIKNGKVALDNTGVHPESYAACKAMLDKFGYKQSDFENQDMYALEKQVKKYGTSRLAKELEIGVPTLNDIIKELEKPGLDIRDELPKPLMRSGDIMTIEDLKPGDVLVGTVRNITDFGAFVDIGVHEDGLVHISQISENYIKHPLDVVKVGQIVKVKVLEADIKRGRIALTMKGVQQ